MIDNWFSAGSLIAGRLETKIPVLAPVREIAAIADIGSLTLSSPSAFICWAGDRFIDTAGGGETQIVLQHWHIILAVRSAYEAAHGSGVISIAGPLIAQILQVLGGWEPSPDHRRLTRVSSIDPGSSAGFTYYPLTYATAVSVVN